MSKITQATIDKVNKLEEHLAYNIKGQAHVIKRVCSVLKRGELGLAHPERPKGTFLFVGPTGVGKTEITLTYTKYIFGSTSNVVRFDMSEFQNQNSVGIMLGENETQKGQLGHYLDKVDRGTILFDEIEKAHPLVLDLFLQILDAGRITLANGETKALNQFYIVLTSNIGAAEAMRMTNVPMATIERTILNRVNQTLRPELVGRITEKVVFGRLTFDIQREICDLMIERELKRLADMGHQLTIDKDGVEFLIRHGFHSLLGARPMRGTVERFFCDAVTEALLSGKEAFGPLKVDHANDKLYIETQAPNVIRASA